MKNKINITISKDTPAETLSELCAVLKTSEKPKRKQPLYALNEDIEKLHARYEELFKQVKTSLNLSANQIEKECETLSRKYDFELEELSKRRKLDYDKQQAEIEARELEETPWRRGWWWRLIFQPLTNRAQDIIERRAELEAEQTFAPIEKELDELDEKLYSETGKKLSERKRKRLTKKYLKLKRMLIIANTAPLTTPATSRNVGIEQRASTPPQLPGQMTLDDVQKLTPVHSIRRPRPPRNCRKA